METASDEEALQRKLHLMQAEIRHTLRGASVARQRQAIRNLYAAGLLCAVLLLSLGVARMVPTTSALRYATTDAGARLPAMEETGAAESVPVPVVSAPAVIAKAEPAVTHVHGANPARRGSTPATHPAKPASKPQTPAFAPPTAEPAVVTPERASEPAKTEPEVGLDALALLSSLESEFEK